MRLSLGVALFALLIDQALCRHPYHHHNRDENGNVFPRTVTSNGTATAHVTASPVSTQSHSSTPASIQSALQIVQDAQAAQAKVNQARYVRPLRNHYKLRPTSDRNHTPKNLTYGGNDHQVARAAVIVAEYEAKKLAPANGTHHTKRAGSFWMEGVSHGSYPLGASGYQVFRNVMDFGAVGDGVTDDTAAINNAISSGNRCGQNCGSSTTTPAIVYFPAGSYLVSSPIISYYNTQLIGNAATRPTIIASSAFIGLGVISSDVYIPNQSGAEWYINQNNFLRQVRNFIIDLTAVPNVMQGIDTWPAGIHWQVAQATSLQNIQIKMSSRAGTTHVGIFMENGSGGFMSDVSFSGGNIGAYLGNQQFTIRGFSFDGCNNAVQMLWDWAFTMKSFTINNCKVGFNLTGSTSLLTSPDASGQGTGSITLLDSSISNTPIGILATTPSAAGASTIIVQNLKLSGVATAIEENGKRLVSGGVGTIDSWVSGKIYTANADTDSSPGGASVAGAIPGDLPKPAVLLGSNGWFERSKPQYEAVAASGFVDAKAKFGAKGNGRSDDTAALNAAFAYSASNNVILWIPHGIYLVTDTIAVPPGAKVVGECWPQIMGTGNSFSDIDNPHVMVQVGKSGDTGTVELQDLLFTVRGATAGAILMEWNIKESSQGSAAMCDCHFRVGGAVGSNLQSSQCPKGSATVDADCIAGTMLMHVTTSASGYFENVWAWTADHDMDVVAQTQINIFVGRGILVESQGPTWFWGTASEHNVLYQYQFAVAKNAFLGMIQTESPYFQSSPSAPLPFGKLPSDQVVLDPGKRRLKRDGSSTSPFPLDPAFRDCGSLDPTCAVSWALRLDGAENIHIYGAGMYSWFQNYDQGCLSSGQCQGTLAGADSTSGKLQMHNIITIGANVMLKVGDGNTVLNADGNKNGFASSAMGMINPKAATPEGSTTNAATSSGSSGPNNGDALAILSTSRYKPQDDKVPLDTSKQQHFWEYYQLDKGSTISCDYLSQNAPLAQDTNTPDTFGSYPGPPSEKTVTVYGFSCTYSAGTITTWDNTPDGGQYGQLTCDGFSAPVGCFKPQQMSGGTLGLLDYTCADTPWYIVDVVCYFQNVNSLVPRAGPGGVLNPFDITLQLFRDGLRRPNFYRANTQLFYTRRNNYRDGMEGLSNRARFVGATLGFLTIWEGWRSQRLDGFAWPDYYGMNDGRNWLRQILESPRVGTPGQRDYFHMMSTVFAEQAQGVVYVMTEDPANTRTDGIWGEAELVTMRNLGQVSIIIAIDIYAGNPHVIYDRTRPSITPENPVTTTVYWTPIAHGLGPTPTNPPKHKRDFDSNDNDVKEPSASYQLRSPPSPINPSHPDITAKAVLQSAKLDSRFDDEIERFEKTENEIYGGDVEPLAARIARLDQESLYKKGLDSGSPALIGAADLGLVNELEKRGDIGVTPIPGTGDYYGPSCLDTGFWDDYWYCGKYCYAMDSYRDYEKPNDWFG